MRKVLFSLFVALSACLSWTGCGPKLTADEDDGMVLIDYSTEAAVQVLVKSFYETTARFLNTQMLVESYIYKGDWQRIGRGAGSDLNKLWKDGYNIVYRANSVILELRNINDSAINYQKGQYITHLSVLRDFVLYNMNHLWGGIPLQTEDNISNEWIPRSEEDEVYQYILDNLRDVLKEIASHPADRWDAGKGCVSERGIYMLMIECYLARKEWLPAINFAEVAANGDDGEFFILKDIPVYSKAKAQLYLKEAARETAGLDASWDETFFHAYGYWATLKRLGIARQKLRCEEYQLLLPIPDEALMLNPNLVQNPGY